ncbi:MAG: aas, partial [Lacunisphaera sp.]|nr:aas [Lacunisphaera sp.]
MKSPRVPLTGLLLRPASLVAELWRVSPLRRATFGLMFFFGVGGYLCLLFLRLDRGLLPLWAGLGALLGVAAAGVASRRGPELGVVPLGGLVLIIALFALGQDASFGSRFVWWLMVAGFGGGLFLMPLAGYLRQAADDSRPGLIAAGWLSGLGVLAGSVMFYFFATPLGMDWSETLQFRVLAGLTLFMTLFALKHLPHQTLCTVMRLIGPLFYRVRVLGHRQVPAGGALVVCNHLSYVDAVVLQIAAPRPLRFIAFAGFVKSPVMRFIFRAAGVIPVNANKPSKGIRLAVEAIRQGELVCIFPEGAISRTGQLMQLRRGFGLISELAVAPIVPAVIDGLWGSVFSFAGNKYLWKSPRLMPTPVCVMFGPPLPPAAVDRGSVRRAMMDLGEAAFQERPVLRRHLAREVVRSLARRPRHVEIVDRTAERREMTAAQLLAVAAALSRRLRKNVPEKRIGIVLPPGAGAHIANLAVACAGKTPVNLNFTVGRSAIEASLRLGEIRTVLTADALRSKLPNFPFPENTLDLRREIEAAGGRRAILPWLVAAWVLPNQWVATLLGLPRLGDHEEAALLFTSGSSGEPKGVVLTHRNILANCAQISSLSILPDTAVLLGCLPVFHSFGFTVTLWYPMLRGCRIVTLPSPLDTRKIAEAISQEKVTVML